ncbi:glycoside hydrolase family 2 TIM barrel-domain containing protein [Saccharicrinis fermentans]|uniref:Beta-galactosidase n=1 Tax=Saccharicrinis fermentans DSM 9555 = JCM 21142 TaxID=869213 RepID=W7YE74_9BACT|nr:glycoside hydrolase family 2 TIM barrel-domain containing protein [Saccharicrinis fermentans]GAF02761.1 beta-galactosidase [Saccharicrinis fermentans DSM 9555 = JCM 21142]
MPYEQATIPPSPELLEICDKLGIVVLVEAFDEWELGKVPNGYSKHFKRWHERDLRDMIKRDRNHPSVIMWSIGNEILEQSKKDGWKITKRLTDICHDEDPTRPTTAGFNYYPAPFKNKLADYVDIIGMNYWPLNYQEILDMNPNYMVYGSETSSQTSSRGVYHLPIEAMPKIETNQVSSYDAIVGPPWAYPPDVEFEQQEKVERSLGEFMWTGFDYLGEPTPYGGRDNSTHGYWNDNWPSHSSYFAPVDLCGFPKDRYYLYQSQWTSKPMVHVLPHWNWQEKEGDTIPVFAYTNCDEVELFVNEKSMGRKVKGVDLTPIPAEFHFFEKGTYMSKYRLSWKVPIMRAL